MYALVALAAALALLIPAFANANRAGAADSTVYVTHGIPGVDVDVYVGSTSGSPAIPGFQYGDTAGPLQIPAGPLPVFVVLAGQDPTVPANVVITQTLDVPSGANVSVVADLSTGVPALTPFVNDASAVAAGSTRVSVRHAANAPTVNVLVNGQVTFTLAAGEQGSADLPAGTYDFQVQLTDGTPLPSLSPGSVTLPGAQNGLTVYATGSVTPINQIDFPLGLVLQNLDLPVAAAPTTTAPPAASGVTATPAVTG